MFKSSKSNDSVTGRDGYIMAQALYWAIKFSERQPDHLREWSNEQDMKAILNDRWPAFAEGFTFGDQLAGYETRKLIAAGRTGPEIDEWLEHYVPPSLLDEKRSREKPVNREDRIKHGDAKVGFFKTPMITTEEAA